MVHILELAVFLAIDQLASIAQDGQRGKAFIERNLVLIGEVLVSVRAIAGLPGVNVDPDMNEVGINNGLVLRILEVAVNGSAIAAPIRAKVEQDSFVTLRGGFQRGGQVGSGLRGSGVECSDGMNSVVDGKKRENRRKSQWQDNPQREPFEGLIRLWL